MMCYKDRTFCNFFDCKKFATCDRAFTSEVKKDAKGYFVSFYSHKPKCHTPIISDAKLKKALDDRLELIKDDNE